MAPCKERDATMPLDDGEVGEIVQGGIQVGIGVSSSDWLQKYASSSISIEVCRWQVSFPLRNAKVKTISTASKSIKSHLLTFFFRLG